MPVVAPPWIPSEAEAFLDVAHLDHAYGLTVDWIGDYGHWKYCYAPGFQELVQDLFPDMSCRRFQGMLRPYIPLAIQLIPAELKREVPPVQPSDWTALPNDQIRSVWDTSNTGFGKTILACVALQILIYANYKSFGELSTNGKLIREQELFDALSTVQILDVPVVFDRVKIHLSAFAFLPHEGEFWHGVLADIAKYNDFMRFTGQRSRLFLQSLADGELATIQTLRAARAWARVRAPSQRIGSIKYFGISPEQRRVRACRRETVHPREAGISALT